MHITNYIQTAIDHINHFNNISDLDKERNEIEKSIKIIKNANLPILQLYKKIEEIEKIIETYDKKISESLAIITNTSNLDNLILYRSQGHIKVDILDQNAGFLRSLIFKIKKFLWNDNTLFSSIYKSANAIAIEHPEFKEKILNSVTSLKSMRNARSAFYESTETIKMNNKLTTQLNVILDSIIDQEGEKAFQETCIENGKKVLENLNTVQSLQNLCGMAITSTVATENEEAFIDQGGLGIFTTVAENEYLHQLLEGKSEQILTDHERTILESYVKDLDRSLDLNYMLASPQRLDDKQMEEWARLSAKMAFEQIAQLKEGESIFIDVGYSGHSMRAQFVKKAGEIEINLFDTSGALELWLTKNPVEAISHHFFAGKKEFITLTTHVSLKEFTESGRAYLEQIISMESGTVDKLLENKSNYFRYMDFIRVFRSIHPKGTLATKQTVQKSGNCFAQRIRACEAHCLGRALYKKARIQSLNYTYDQLYKYAKSGLTKMEWNRLKNHLTNLKELNQSELNKVRQHLSELTELPNSVEDWYAILALNHHNIVKTRKITVGESKISPSMPI